MAVFAPGDDVFRGEREMTPVKLVRLTCAHGRAEADAKSLTDQVAAFGTPAPLVGLGEGPLCAYNPGPGIEAMVTR